MNELLDPVTIVPVVIYDAALVEINTIRKLLGAQPLDRIPMGVRGSTCRCPVANALNLTGNPKLDISVNHIEIFLRKENYFCSSPPAIADFIAHFDEHKEE